MNFKNTIPVFFLLLFYHFASGQNLGSYNQNDKPDTSYLNKKENPNNLSKRSIFQKRGTNQTDTEQKNLPAETQFNYRTALSYFTNGQIDSAILFAKKTLSTEKDGPIKLYSKAGHGLLSECYLLKTDFKNAYLHKAEELKLIKKNQPIAPSVFMDDISFLKKLEELKTGNQHLLKNQKKYAYFILFLLALFLAAIYFVIKYKSKKYNKILEEKITKHTLELERKNKKLKQSLSEMERFSHILSHDLKEPFRNIISFSDLSIRDLKKNKTDNLPEYLGFISSSSKQMYNLIEKTNDFTKVESTSALDTNRIDLNVLLKEIKSKMQLEKENMHKILLYHNLPVFYENRDLLEKLLIHLIHNGWKYNNDISPTVVIAYRRLDGHHILTIRDNGIGIKKEFQEEVFKMYVRLDDRGKNSSAGLGLSISQKIAQQLGGNIIVAHSSLQEGTALEIRLPVKKTVGQVALN